MTPMSNPRHGMKCIGEVDDPYSLMLPRDQVRVGDELPRNFSKCNARAAEILKYGRGHFFVESSPFLWK